MRLLASHVAPAAYCLFAVSASASAQGTAGAGTVRRDVPGQVEAGEAPAALRLDPRFANGSKVQGESASPVRRRARAVVSGPSVPGLGPALAARIRTNGARVMQRFIARGVSRSDVEASGGRVTAEIGPILAGRIDGGAALRLAESADLIDAPKPHRPLLDVSRLAVRVDRADEGRDLPGRFRGSGAIVAAYDSGVDLLHPDLRALDGPSRAIALWDQTAIGTPPRGQTIGHECDRAALEADACASTDPGGHGTHVLSIALGNGPGYRGMAPEAEAVVARSEDFDLFVETLAWFAEIAEGTGRPMVVNLSIGGHEGPHDGTSLESQAIDAYPYLVIAASGNDGVQSVHAGGVLRAGQPRDVALRFPASPSGRTARAIVEIWGGGPEAPSAQGLIMRPSGIILAETSSVGPGDPGRTEEIETGAARANVLIDAETEPNRFNAKWHVRLEVDLPSWQDPPAGAGYFVVRIRGEGYADLWVDTPPTEPAPVAFDDEGVLGVESQLLGDTMLSVSDLSTAVSALSVAAYTTRTEFPIPGGQTRAVDGVIGEIARFSSHGPSVDPDRTGAKPDIAAPGHIIVGAKSRASALDDPGMVSPLYRASAGTSLASPHVAGVAALVLGGAPTMGKADLRALILATADRERVDADPRWGAGKVDGAAVLEEALGVAEGCGCRGTSPSRQSAAEVGLLLGLLWLAYSLPQGRRRDGDERRHLLEGS